MNNQLQNYIKQMREAGKSDGEIRAELLKAGWTQEMINAEMGAHGKTAGADKREQNKQEGAMEPINKEEKKKGMNKKKIILFSGLGLVIVITSFYLSFPFVANILASDLDTVNDSNLTDVEVANVQESDNAFLELQKLSDTGDVPELQDFPDADFQYLIQHLEGEVWDEKYVEAMLSASEENLRIFDTAVQKSKYQDPNYADPRTIDANTSVSGLQQLRPISRISALKALYLSRQGSYKEAMEESMKLMKLGQMIMESNSTLLHQLTGIAIRSLSTEYAFGQNIQHARLSSLELKNIIKELEEYQQTEEAMSKAFKIEYMGFANYFDALSQGEDSAIETFLGINSENGDSFKDTVKNQFYFKPNKTKQRFADRISLYIGAADTPCNELNFESLDQEIKSYTDGVFIGKVIPWKRENFVGNIIYSTNLVNHGDILAKRCEDEFRIAATQVLLASKAYQMDNGSPAGALEDLIPDYISEMPLDSFSGESLNYKLEEDKITITSDSMYDDLDVFEMEIEEFITCKDVECFKSMAQNCQKGEIDNMDYKFTLFGTPLFLEDGLYLRVDGRDESGACIMVQEPRRSTVGFLPEYREELLAEGKTEEEINAAEQEAEEFFNTEEGLNQRTTCTGEGANIATYAENMQKGKGSFSCSSDFNYEIGDESPPPGESQSNCTIEPDLTCVVEFKDPEFINELHNNR